MNPAVSVFRLMRLPTASIASNAVRSQSNPLRIFTPPQAIINRPTRANRFLNSRSMSTTDAAPASATATATATASHTPMADAIQTKLASAFSPALLTIHNDSHQHSHHMAMRTHPAHQHDSSSSDAGADPETHFRVYLVSTAFEGKMPAARHRMVYATLKEELARQDGVHALQIVARTPAEEEKKKQQQQQKSAGNPA